jgi:hypothetical protein
MEMIEGIGVPIVTLLAVYKALSGFRGEPGHGGEK